MSSAVSRRLAAVVAVLAIGPAVFAAGCSAPSVQGCQRYDTITLTRENAFSGRIDWKHSRSVDLPVERIEVALTAVRPMRGPVELVHVVGDREADRWLLTLPEWSDSPTTLCSLSSPGPFTNCGATLANLPLSPGGYWFLRAGDNAVLEAGLSFYLCD